MQTNELINQLTKHTTPVKPLMHPILQTGIWLLFSAFYFIALSAFMGIREDLVEMVQQPLFSTELILATITALTAAVVAICLSVPDAYQKLWLRWIAVVGFSALTLLLLYRLLATEHYDDFMTGLGCSGEVCLYAFIPGVFLVLMLRRAATVHSGWAGAMCGLAVGLFGYIFLRLTEPNDDILHLMTWHYLPLLAIVALGTICGIRCLKW